MCENGNHCDIRHSFRSRAIFSGSAARAVAVADCGKRAYRKERRRDEGGKASAREERQLRLARAHRSTSARLFKVEMVAGVCLYLWGNLRGRTSFVQSAAKSQSRGPLVAAAACPGFGCDIRLWGIFALKQKHGNRNVAWSSSFACAVAWHGTSSHPFWQNNLLAKRCIPLCCQRSFKISIHWPLYHETSTFLCWLCRFWEIKSDDKTEYTFII